MTQHNVARSVTTAACAAAMLLLAAVATTATADSSIAPWVQLGGLPGMPGEGLAADPRDGRIVYADGGGGRIATSFSRGAHWDVNQVGGIFELFRAISVDPANTATVLAFSTSDTDGGATGGVYVSRDHGVRWQRLPHQPTGPLGTAGLGRGILADARGTTLLIADKLQGIFRSADFGATWTNSLPAVTGSRFYSLARDPNDPLTYWAGGFDATGATAVWVSHDLGRTWTEIALPVDAALQDDSVTALAVEPRTGRIVAGTNGFTADFTLGGDIYTSDDGGAHWNASVIAASQWAAGNTLVFDPANAQLAYASGNGTLGLLRSTDGGLSWTQQLTADGGGFFALAVSPGVDGGGSRVFGTGGGTLEVSDDGGIDWTKAQRGLDLSGASLVEEDGRTPGGLYSLNGEGGLVHSVDGGITWTPIDPTPGVADTLDFTTDPVSWNHPVYAFETLLSSYTLARSDDGGRHWRTLGVALPATFQEQLLADPRRGGTVYVFTATPTAQNALLRSVDYGATWQSSTIGLEGDYAATPAPLAADGNHPGVLYAAMGSGLWKSTDFGASWNPVPNLPLGIYGIAGMAVTDGAAGAVLVGASDDVGNVSLQQSRDGGTTWTTGASPFGAAPYLLSAAGGNAFAYQWLYVGCSDPSVLQSGDSGQTWTLVDAPIENSFDAGDCINISPTVHRLYVADPYGTYLSFATDLGSRGSGRHWQQRPRDPSQAAAWAAMRGARKGAVPATLREHRVRER